MLSIADTVVLVLMPGSGDSVQALKAGIMEIPDVIAINKSDHPQARQTANDVRQVLALAAAKPPSLSPPPSAPQPPIVLTEAMRGEGIEELWDAIDAHRAGLEAATGRSTSAGGATWLGRGVRGCVGAGAPAPGESRSPTIPSCGGCSIASNSGSSIRSPPCIPSSRPCSTSPTAPTPMATKTGPSLADIQAARERIGDRARMTAVHPAPTRSSFRTGREVLLKAENLQRTGSFKIRGAVNILASLSAAERAAGVIAASAGNHGQAVAYAARELGVRATIVMPQDAPMSKVEPTLRYGAEAVLHGGSFDDAIAEAKRRVEETGATLIHAFEDERVIAGQGTIGLELAEQLPRRRRAGHPGGRRRPRLRHRDRDARAAAGGAPRSACIPSAARTRSPTASRSSTRAR